MNGRRQTVAPRQIPDHDITVPVGRERGGSVRRKHRSSERDVPGSSQRLADAKRSATSQMTSRESFPAVTTDRPSGVNSTPVVSNWAEACPPCPIDRPVRVAGPDVQEVECGSSVSLVPSPLFSTIAATSPFGLMAISFPPSGKRLIGVRSAFHTTVGPCGGRVVTSERPSGRERHRERRERSDLVLAARGDGPSRAGRFERDRVARERETRRRRTASAVKSLVPSGAKAIASTGPSVRTRPRSVRVATSTETISSFIVAITSVRPSGLKVARSVPDPMSIAPSGTRRAASKNSTEGEASPIASVRPSGEIAIHWVSFPAGDAPPVLKIRSVIAGLRWSAANRALRVSAESSRFTASLAITRASSGSCSTREREARRPASAIASASRAWSALRERETADHERGREQERDTGQQATEPAVGLGVSAPPLPPPRSGSSGGTSSSSSFRSASCGVCPFRAPRRGGRPDTGRRRRGLPRPRREPRP